jgi:hypothetical protein
MASFQAGDLMSRSVLVGSFLAFALQVSQAQTFSHGAPASVVSPTADGRQHGVPASVVSPTQLPFGVQPPQRSIRIHGPLRRFGNPRSHRQVFLPIPVFYPFYNDGGYPSAADPYVPDSSSADPAPAQQQAANDRSDDELRAAYLQGARDAMSQQADSRYGEHSMDSRERRRPPQEERKSEKREDNDPPAAVPVEDKTPAAVFIFKDGHQLETKNYAIMNGTLIDFSSKTLKKIQLDEIDSAATLKANDDRGVAVKLN